VLGLPYESSAASLVFGVAVATVALAEVWIRVRTRRSEGTRHDPGSRLPIAVSMGLGVLGAVEASARWPGGTLPWPWVWFLAGVGATAAGLTLRIAAVRTLGRWFTTDVRIAADQRVVTSGPYRWVRHPSYTGLLLELAGIGLMLTDWLSLLSAVAAPLPALLWRIRIEERALTAGLGSAYIEYAESRSRLLPRVW